MIEELPFIKEGDADMGGGGRMACSGIEGEKEPVAERGALDIAGRRTRGPPEE